MSQSTFLKDVYDSIQFQQMQCYQPYDCSWNAQNEYGLVIQQMCYEHDMMHNMWTNQT
jgi:hypothetical protein